MQSVDDLAWYLATIARTPLLTREQEYALGERVQRGDRRAAEALVRANLRLVVSVAKRYRGRADMLDLIQDGNLGLMHAVDKFDPERGCRMSTYATPWIRQTIQRGLDERGGTIRIPVHMAETIRFVRRHLAAFATDRGREPTEAELARATGLPLRKVRQALSAPGSTLSLDSPGLDDGSPLLDSLAGSGPSADDALGTHQREATARELLGTLTPRQRGVLERRLGVEEATLEEIGDGLGLTRERVRQIAIEALGRLRGTARFRRVEG